MWRFLTSNTTSHNRNASSAIDTSLQVLPCVSVDQVQHSHIERLLNRHIPLEHSQWSAMIIITNDFGCCKCVFLIDLWQTMLLKEKMTFSWLFSIYPVHRHFGSVHNNLLCLYETCNKSNKTFVHSICV